VRSRYDLDAPARLRKNAGGIAGDHADRLAATSKRSLYSHFKSKDKLFLAIADLVREIYLDKLKTPGDYAEDTAEAVVLFCGRFLQLLLWEPRLRACCLGTPSSASKNS
jgi:AcrR family transcriptional regulator